MASKYYRNTRPIGWVDSESLWVEDGAGNLHLVSSDESYEIDASDRLIGAFIEVDEPPELHPSDAPLED